VKNIAYVPYTPFPCVAGDHIEVAGTMWTCLTQCTVIGHTVIDQLPVLKDSPEPRVNVDELITGQYTGVVDGQVAVEFEIVEAFKQADPKDLAGKRVRVCSYNMHGALIVIFDDQTYMKVEPERDWDDTILAETAITVEDLRRLHLVKETDWDHYLAQQQSRTQSMAQRSGRQQLSNAVAKLGRNAVLELLKE